MLGGIDLDAVRARGYGFQIEMTYRAVRNGFRVEEVPDHVRRPPRRVSRRCRAQIFFEALTMVWKMRARIPRGGG